MLLKAQPEKSNRQIAEQVKASHVTVGAVRTELEGRGQINHVEIRVDTKGRHQPANKPKATQTAAIEREIADAGSEKWKADRMQSIRRYREFVDERIARDAQPQPDAPVDAGEVAGLVNAVRVGLAGLDPILDRIAQLGVDAFWRQAGAEVRHQVGSTVGFLQTIVATAPVRAA